MEYEELLEMVNEFGDLYDRFKAFIKEYDSHEYERWKAGGFLVDQNIVSMYPNMLDILDTIADDLDEQEELEDEDD